MPGRVALPARTPRPPTVRPWDWPSSRVAGSGDAVRAHGTDVLWPASSGVGASGPAVSCVAAPWPCSRVDSGSAVEIKTSKLSLSTRVPLDKYEN